MAASFVAVLGFKVETDNPLKAWHRTQDIFLDFIGQNNGNPAQIQGESK